jgi:Tat protein secretion system quality control protein TatD with DNase activity
MVIDCHSHFYPPQFARADIPALAAAARQAGVQAIVTVPESLQDCQEVLQLAKEEPLVQACAGLHPVQPIHSDGHFYSSCRYMYHYSLEWLVLLACSSQDCNTASTTCT